MFRKTLMALCIALIPISASATENGTREEAVAMVERAVALYQEQGLERAIQGYLHSEDADFRDKDLFVFAVAFDGTVAANSAIHAMVGKNILEMTDLNGKHFIKEMITLANEKGSGWIDYYMNNPATGKIHAKSSWIQRIGDKHLVGVGVYAE